MSKLLHLGEFAEIGAGNSAPQNEKLFVEGTFSFVRTSDVGAIHIGSISTSRDLLTSEGIKGLKLQPTGTILFPKSGASTFLNHRVILSLPAYVSSHLATIKVDNDLALDSYVFYFLQTIDARDLCQDQAYPSLNRDQIAQIQIQLPSLEKQREIVEKLDSTFADIDKLNSGTDLRMSLTLDLFKQICREKTQKLGPSSFKTLKELASVITKGTTPTSLGHKFRNEGVNFLKVESLDAAGGFIKTKFAYIDLDCQKALKRSQLKEFDVLVSIAGALGRTAIVTEYICPANINQALSIVRLPENSEITPNFLFSLFQSGYFSDDLDQMGAGAAQQNLSLAQIGSLRVPIFSKAKQEKFINFLFELRAQVTHLTDQYEKKILLKRKLQDSILFSVFNTVDFREKTA